MRITTEAPLISIIIPIYNVESYLYQCLESVEQQTYKCIEVLLVNDGSTDSSGKIAKQFVEKDSRFCIIELNHAGLSSARNAGLDVAKGEFVTFIDGDDYVDEHYCEKALSCALEKNVDIVTFGFNTFSDGQQVFSHHYTRWPRLISKEEGIDELIKREDVIYNYAWNKIFKKELFRSIRFPVGRAFEDIAIMHLVFNESKADIYVSDDILYYYRQNRNGSITSKWHSPNSLHDRMLNQLERFSFIKKYYPSLCDSQVATMTELCLKGLVFLPAGNSDLIQMKQFLKSNRKLTLEVCHGLRKFRLLTYYYFPPLFHIINVLMKKYIYK